MRAVAMRSWLAKSLMIVLLVDVGGYSATAQTGELAALNRQVEELYYDGKYGEAAALAERSLELTRAQKGQNHLETADSMYWVALVYHSQGRYSEAEPLLKRTLAIREKALGRDAYSVGTVLNKLANLYEILGRYSEAEPIYKRALAISEKLRGPDDLEVGTALNNLAVLYGSQGRMRDAESFHKRAITVYEKSLGPDHFLVGNSLNNLAVVYSSQGRGREAEPLYKRALAVYERARGPDDPTVGGGLNSLAELYRDQGRYAEAEPLYKRALAIREKALGPDNEAVAASLNNLAVLYFSQGRARDAEPLFKRALAVYEKAFGPDHPHLGHALNNLAALYSYLGQDGEAEPLYKRVLAISAKALGPDDPGVGTPLNNLAILYRNQGRFNEAELLYKRALAVLEKALGADHALVGSTLGNLGRLYQAQGRDGEAELLYKRDLTISEKALGLDHPSIGTTLDYLAGLYLLQKDWKRAADTWRRSTGVIVHRAQRGMGGGGETLMGKGKSEATRSSYQFFGLVKMVHRLATDGREADASLTREMFQTGQWAQASEAASSLAQMAARGATGDAGLSRLVRERQDLIADWQKRDGVRSAAVSQAPDKRNRAAETANLAQLTEIEKQLADIDQRLKSDFPDYAALSQPEPLSVEQVQADLRSDEALVMFLDTHERKPTPEETFIWVVTKSDMRWVRSELGTPALTREVAALRCGLDATAWTGSSCFDLTGKVYTDADRAGGKPLPFDHTRAHKLYTALFGEVADLIMGKQLLIVPSGPLTTLPFQVLVTSLPVGFEGGAISRKVGRLGVELGPISDSERRSLPTGTVGGVKVIQSVPGGPAEAAGLRAGDLLLTVENRSFLTVPEAVAAVQAAGPDRAISLRLVRDGRRLDLPVTLGAATVTDWKPLYVDSANAKDMPWLIRDHAITVLPSVASLSSLRRTGKPSTAPNPMIGFANPLLDGNQSHPQYGDWYKQQAERARSQSGCAAAPKQVTAALRSVSRSASPVPQLAGLADLTHLRMQTPLPETADEVCEVARSIGAEPSDMRIGARTTETEVKRLSKAGELAKYRIVHFATHGLLAGQLTGTREPGLILTPPAQATSQDDGYLSGSEIASLKLDADWVILSACNTAGGAGQGEAAEALSGLARVFFYAGARALLVSHWEVDSAAAVKLVTGAIGEMTKDKRIGRSEALRRAMVTTMADTTRQKNWVPAWHPAVWAPFVVVGEGGAGR